MAARWKRQSLRAHIDDFRRAVGDEACWPWGGRLTPKGYARTTNGVGGKLVMAHRAVYEMERRTVEAGETVDHLCRNRACMNPAHLEAVPHVENVRRGDSSARVYGERTHCRRGHLLSGDNLRADTLPYRGCRQCKLDTMRQWRERQSA